MSNNDVLARGAARLHAAGIESSRLDARILFSLALGISSDDLFSAKPTQAQIDIFDSLITRRAGREPLAYITGRKEFWSLQFQVGPGVLIPRPETETLIEEVLRKFPDPHAPLHVLDIGTGSGCLLVALLKERHNAHGLGVDNSEAALVYARGNAARHGLDVRCSFQWAEAADALRKSTTLFDVILANPPYLTDEEFTASATEIKSYEPPGAFQAGGDGLEAFRTFLPLFADHLAPDGMAFVEIGAGQVASVSNIVVDATLEVRDAVPDLSGIPRCLAIGRVGRAANWRP